MYKLQAKSAEIGRRFGAPQPIRNVFHFALLCHEGLKPIDYKDVKGFAIAGGDKKFHWAQAKVVKPNEIEVSSKEITDPVAVRYGWADNPVCNVYETRTLLPLTPFRSDDWDGVTKDVLQ